MRFFLYAAQPNKQMLILCCIKNTVFFFFMHTFLNFVRFVKSTVFILYEAISRFTAKSAE